MKNEKPLVTVVTVTYNSSKYVRDTIESVLAQTYENIEYIILDDNSTDNTWDIITEYKDSRIRAIRNEQNLREYPNRNKAISLANGEYLLYIDGDDVLFTHGVAFFVEQLSAFPEAAFAVQKGYYNNILFPALLEPDEVYQNFFFGNSGLLSSSLASNFFRISYLKECEFKTKYISGDDDLRLRLASRYPVLFVSGFVSWPRETPGQASSKITASIALVETYRMIEDLFNEENCLNSILKKAIKDQMRHKMCRNVISMLFKFQFKQISIILDSKIISVRSFVDSFKYTPEFKDFFVEHNTINPFKRSLNRVYNQIK